MLVRRANLIIYLISFLFINMIFFYKSCFAATATTTFNVTATVLDGCSVTATNMSFGTFINTTTSTTTNTINVICNNETQYSIALTPGNNGGPNFTRNLVSGNNLLPYNIYKDNAYTQIWGDGTGGSTTMANLVANGSEQSYTAFGKIPPIENEPASGTYADTITVSVNYN
jgi:spore coat protein U-like protein